MMSRMRAVFAGILLSGVVAWAAPGITLAQVWEEDEPAKPATESVKPATDWSQRVLRQPVKPLQWVDPQASGKSRPTVRRTSYEDGVFEEVPAPKASAPRTPSPTPQPIPQALGQEAAEPDAMQFEPMASDGEFADAHQCGDCGGCGDCDACCGEEACEGWEVFDGRCGPWLKGLSIFAGVDGSKGPLDRGTNGSFGMNEGVNLARPLGDPWGCGYQVGANFVQSNFSGAPLANLGDYPLRAACRRQYFLTAALFRRATACRGFQWGVAYDFLQDDYYQKTNLQQIRSLSSFVLDPVYEIGYYGAYGVATDRALDGKLDPIDMFVGFVKRNFENGGDGRLWAGASGQGDALLGADLWIPLGRGFALENRINYLVPKQGRGETAQSRESWGLVIQLVWYPGQNAKCQQSDPYRPMFNVADNSLFMVDRLTGH